MKRSFGSDVRPEDVARSLWPPTKLAFNLPPTYKAGLVSVITPTFDREHYIRRCLESVWSQSYRPIEHLIIDDGSTDQTAELVERHARSREDETFSIRYIKQENAGAPAARNRGLIESHGEFIQYLDSDDVLHPWKVEVHVRALRKAPPCDYVWSHHNNFDADRSEAAFACYDPDALLEESTLIPRVEAFTTSGNVWTGLYRRSICGTIGPWNEELKRWQDLDYQMRLTSLAPACRYVNAVLGAMGNHKASRIQELGRKAEGIEPSLIALRSMEKTLDAFQQPRGTLARHSVANFYIGLAKLALLHDRQELADWALRGALRNRDERKFRARVALLNGLRSLVGSRATAAVMNAYSDWRLGL